MNEVEPCVREMERNRREVPQGRDWRRPHDWVGLLFTRMELLIYPTSKQKSELYGNIITLRWDVVEGMCYSIILSWTKELSLLISSLSSNTMNFNSPFSSLSEIFIYNTWIFFLIQSKKKEKKFSEWMFLFAGGPIPHSFVNSFNSFQKTIQIQFNLKLKERGNN